MNRFQWEDREEKLRQEREAIHDDILDACSRLGPELRFLIGIMRFLDCVWQDMVNRGFTFEAAGARECVEALREIGKKSQQEG